jgi:type I restriction enzyme S subunit
MSKISEDSTALMAHGSAQMGLYLSDVKKINIILPPLYEQKRIAEFLDKKCSEIDSLTADIQSEIEILEAYKRSNITEAVTKGLDRNVSMKESGVEWLGKIPEHWDISRIGSIYRLRNTKVNDRDYKPLSVTMKGVVPQLDTAAKTNAHDDRKLVRKGDFVINSRSDRRGSCGISSLDGSVSLINTVLAPLDEMNAEYYGWLFHTVQFADEFYKWGHGIVDDLWTTGWQDMKKIIIPYPPLQEQECIAKHLNDKCEEIDKVLDYKKEQLEVLADYKKSVIYEYVTGKKEVI